MKSEMISYVGHAFCLSLISLGLLCSDETGTSLIKRSSETLPSWSFYSTCIVVANVAVWCSPDLSSGYTLMKKNE